LEVAKAGNEESSPLRPGRKVDHADAATQTDGDDTTLTLSRETSTIFAKKFYNDAQTQTENNLDDDSPISISSLKDVIIRFKSAGMKNANRVLSFEKHEKGSLIWYEPRFNKRALVGWSLIPVEAEAEARTDYQLCVYGCTLKGVHRHLVSPKY
jgi:hypothetical protein